MYITVVLRILLFITLGWMVYDYLRVEQLFIQMDRGFIDKFSVETSNMPGIFFIITVALLILIISIQFLRTLKNKNAILEAYYTPESDVSDERTVENSQKAMSFAFSIILVYSFLILGSYMFLPNYFIDHIWYPMFTTASIPIIGLLTYLTTYQVFARR